MKELKKTFPDNVSFELSASSVQIVTYYVSLVFCYFSEPPDPPLLVVHIISFSTLPWSLLLCLNCNMLKLSLAICHNIYFLFNMDVDLGHGSDQSPLSVQTWL